MLVSFGGPRLRLYGASVSLILSLIILLFLFREALPGPAETYWDALKGQRNFWKGPVVKHETALQHDPPPDQPPYGAIVIAAQNVTDLSWTMFLKAKWNMYEYNVSEPDNSDTRLQFPGVKGHEAVIYLSYIIDNYENLPWSTFFIHGHREAWHQEDDIARIIRGLNLISLARQGYISLRCDWYPSCPAEMRPVHGDAIVWGPGVHRKSTEAAIAGNWKLLFPGVKLPETIASPCCAQFAVTRQAILRRPKADYERLRDWLMGSLLEDDVSGRVLEKLWAYIFTGEAVHCPPPQQCACEWFGRCDRNKWTEPPEGLPPVPTWPSRSIAR